MANDAENAEKRAALPANGGNSSTNEKAADRADRFANGLERVAYKLHDFGNWLMGFIR